VHGIFEPDYGYEFKTGTKYQKERSATIVWNALLELQKHNCAIPLIWNICPFHPYREDPERTNRPPNSDEIAIGIEILNHLLSLFAVKQIGAIGNQSHTALNGRQLSLPVSNHMEVKMTLYRE
jgi:hypothetical protein